jgi:hypothetical protein
MRGNTHITTPTAKPEKHSLRLPDRIGLAIASAVSVLALFTGLMMMTDLSSSFRPADIFYQRPVAAFAAWLLALPEPVDVAADTGSDDGQARAIAYRLLLLPVSPRRAILSAMMDNDFWSGLARSEADRRRFIAVSSRALDLALLRAPLSGAMWLAAAKLRTLQDGFDATAETYLRRSYVLAPREAGVAADRLAFIVEVRALLRADFETDFARDSRIVCQTEPRRYRALSSIFALPDCDRV